MECNCFNNTHVKGVESYEMYVCIIYSFNVEGVKGTMYGI